MGVVVGGFGGGAMVFNQIQTKIVNPNNVKVRLIIPLYIYIYIYKRLCLFIKINLSLACFISSQLTMQGRDILWMKTFSIGCQSFS